MEIRIAGTINDSVVDGEGYRYVVFVQGCPHQCKGCQNPQTWPFVGGRVALTEDILREIKANPLLRGVTFSGGEPFLKVEPLTWLAKLVHEQGLDVWCYTGYTFEELIGDAQKRPLLESVDVLVDGRFVLEQRDLSLRFRGSRNQRIIDVPKSLAQGKAALYLD